MTNESFPIVPSAWPYLVFLLLATALAYYFYPWLAVIPAVLFLFIAYFFRNPKRAVTATEGQILSPADGVIREIKAVADDPFMGGPAVRLSIFLSIFNVHLNRSPVTGRVFLRHYRPGKYIPAFKSHASEVNERNLVGIESSAGPILVTQITGFLARRIVCWAKPGDFLQQGQLFGLIKFGSCTELVLPSHVVLTVQRGQKVKGGVTVVGRLPDAL
ncbi:MAG TPA: phosphatidylserine decarboxylase family protein [Spirochaetia bacterium]|nr:phosphatidylserine decarboxylase family protein [Spirochaetia bacterium]